MHGRLRRVALALVALGLVVAGAARADERNDKLPCRAAEHHQFDFWIGHWDVFLPNGNKAGENRIEVIEGGCALLEQWSGTRGPTGKSLNIYDGLRRVWHQTWVDSTGGLLVLEGHWVDGRMVLSSSVPPIQRITWSPQPDGSVRQLWESSKDGKTWSTAFDGKYVKKKQP
jgi:hypothetical protein